MASNNFINECKNRAYENRLGKLSIDDIEYNQSNNLSSFEIENNIYSNGTIIGNTYSKSIKASLINVDKDTPFVGKTVSPSVGVKYSNNTTEYLDFDDYIVETINDKQTNNLTEITGYDTLDKLNTKYVFGLDENSSHTIEEYWNDLLLNLGFQTHTNTFTNSDIVIPANPFVNNETNRVVLSEIEKVSCSFSKIIKENNTYYLDLIWFDEKESNLDNIEIDGSATINDMARITNLELQGDTQQDGTPTPESPIPVEVVSGLQIITISNQNDTKTYNVNLGNIELCKIGNYQDFIKKGTGINLYNKSTIIEGKYINNTGAEASNSNYYATDYIEVSPDKNLFLNGNTFIVQGYGAKASFYNSSKQFISYVDLSTSQNIFKIPSNAKYFRTSIYKTDIDSLYISYEPYGMYNKWYIEKQIGKLILDGSEIGWVAQSTSTSGLYRYNYNFPLKNGYQNAISSHFEMSEETSFANINTVCFATHPSNHMFCFFVNNDSVDTWRAWLTNNNVTVYYVLENSTFLEITDEELLSKLNSIKAFVGVNNISISSSNLGLLLNIDYYKSSIDYEFQTSDYSTLDGGLIEYGPINSVVLGNKNISGENIVREDTDDIVRDGEHSIFIDAEYFLFNQSLREQAIDGIWKKLYGFRYYDLSLSTPYGKPFLEVGDKIRVNTNEGNVYDTYILSHKFTFDGTFKTELNSPAFTEQEQIVKSTDSISTSIKRTEIMVDKANQEIVSVVQSSEELAGIVNSQGENIESLGTRLTQTVDSFTASISSLQEQVDDGVNYVKTTSVTINDDGLSVSTDTSRIKTTMTNNEFKITDSGETVLAKFGYDETVQNSIAEMDNLTVKNFLVLGNHRVEKCGTNKERTGFFYIGG